MCLLRCWLSRLWKLQIRSREQGPETSTPIPPEDLSPLIDVEVEALEQMQIGSVGPYGIAAPVYRVSEALVVKCLGFPGSSYEPYTSELVASQTSIPIPRLRGAFSHNSSIWIAMDYIEGEDLYTLWPRLTIWRKLWVIWTIRDYIRQLRSVRLEHLNVPGPIDGTGRPQLCVNALFGEWYGGPFSSYDDMVIWFKGRLDTGLKLEEEWRQKGQLIDSPLLHKPVPHFDRSMPLVLTHGDICMRNVRLGNDGKVWLLDWGFSGAYPIWFEYSGMKRYDINRHDEKFSLPWLWRVMIPFMAGAYQYQYSFIDRANAGLLHHDW